MSPDNLARGFPSARQIGSIFFGGMNPGPAPLVDKSLPSGLRREIPLGESLGNWQKKEAIENVEIILENSARANGLSVLLCKHPRNGYLRQSEHHNKPIQPSERIVQPRRRSLWIRRRDRHGGGGQPFCRRRRELRLRLSGRERRCQLR